MQYDLHKTFLIFKHFWKHAKIYHYPQHCVLIKTSRNIQNQMVMLFVSITIIFAVVPLDILCRMNKSREQFPPF